MSWKLPHAPSTTATSRESLADVSEGPEGTAEGTALALPLPLPPPCTDAAAEKLKERGRCWSSAAKVASGSPASPAAAGCGACAAAPRSLRLNMRTWLRAAEPRPCAVPCAFGGGGLSCDHQARILPRAHRRPERRTRGGDGGIRRRVAHAPCGRRGRPNPHLAACSSHLLAPAAAGVTRAGNGAASPTSRLAAGGRAPVAPRARTRPAPRSSSAVRLARPGARRVCSRQALVAVWRAGPRARSSGAGRGWGGKTAKPLRC
jgi:hypothetical protein